MKPYGPFKPGKPKPVRYRLTIEARPHELPANVRLRGVLKRLLRSFGFRCLNYADVTDGAINPCEPIPITAPNAGGDSAATTSNTRASNSTRPSA